MVDLMKKGGEEGPRGTQDNGAGKRYTVSDQLV